MNRSVVIGCAAVMLAVAGCSSSSAESDGASGGTSYETPQDLLDAVRAAGAECNEPNIEPGYYGSDANTTQDVLDIECKNASSMIDITWFASEQAQKDNNALVCDISSGNLHGTPASQVIMGANWRVGNAMVDGQYDDLDNTLSYTGQSDAKSLAEALGGEATTWGTVCDGGYTVS